MDKKLEIAIPSIAGYKHHAIPLAIIETCKGAESWVHQNYLQLELRHNLFIDAYCDIHWLDFNNIHDLYNNNFLATEFMDVYNLSREEIIGKIKQFIDMNFYVYTVYNHFYTKHSQEYNKFHGPNILLIYGYNDEEKIVHVLDYTYTTNNILEPMRIEYDEMVEAILGSAPLKWHGFAKIKKKTCNDRFDPKLTIQLIEDYLDSSHTINSVARAEEEKSAALYGLKTYEALEHYIDLVCQNLTINTILSFHVLMEHKKNLSAHMHYLLAKGHLRDPSVCDESFQLYEKSVYLRNIMLKYFMTHDKTLIEQVKNHLFQIKEKEPIVLNRVLCSIHKGGIV